MGRAEQAGLPAISGGDRHGCEPNALLNLTTARTFGEFVEEIRVNKESAVLVMPQYREPMTSRVLAAIGDVMRDNDGHTHGWTRWSDRVFYRSAREWRSNAIAGGVRRRQGAVDDPAFRGGGQAVGEPAGAVGDAAVPAAGAGASRCDGARRRVWRCLLTAFMR